MTSRLQFRWFLLALTFATTEALTPLRALSSSTAQDPPLVDDASGKLRHDEVSISEHGHFAAVPTQVHGRSQGRSAEKRAMSILQSEMEKAGDDDDDPSEGEDYDSSQDSATGTEENTETWLPPAVVPDAPVLYHCFKGLNGHCFDYSYGQDTYTAPNYASDTLANARMACANKPENFELSTAQLGFGEGNCPVTHPALHEPDDHVRVSDMGPTPDACCDDDPPCALDSCSV